MGDKDSGGNAQNARYVAPSLVSTRGGFPAPTESASQRWGEHFVGCRRCEIGDGPSQDTFCPTGKALADRAAQEGLDALRDMNLTEYLLAIADEHFEEEEHRSRYYSTEELAARERAFMDARLP